MCKTGGPRCENEVRPRLGAIRDELAEIENKLTQLRKDRADLENGKSVKTEAGGYRRIYGVEKEMKQLLKEKFSAKKREGVAQHEWELTNKGIQELREQGKDKLASQRQAEREALLALNRKNMTASEHLRSVMEADGFSPDVIKECDLSPGGSPYPRSASYYLTAREKAVREFRDVTAEANKSISEAKTESRRQQLEAKYARRLESIRDRIREAEHGYFTTPEGLVELQEEANEPGISFTERLVRQTKHDRYASIHNERQSDYRLRRLRKRRITSAYKKAGLDPTEALKTHGLVGGKKRYVPEELRKDCSLDILYTPSEYARLQTEFHASGEQSFSAWYEKNKLLTPPNQFFQGVTLDELNAGIKRAPVGHHRQRTEHEGELRSEQVSLKVSQTTRNILDIRTGSMHETRSSYLRKISLGLDPRQHSNDRSVKTNQERTEKVEEMMRSGKMPA
jgi:hypothetical protein